MSDLFDEGELERADPDYWKPPKEKFIEGAAVIGQTDKAFLVKRKGMTTWIPKSQVISVYNDRVGVHEWLCDKLKWVKSTPF